MTVAPLETDVIKVLKELLDHHFKTVIRWIKRSHVDHVKPLRVATHANLKRLKTRRDLSKAVKGTPKGSDQGDIQSIITWMRKINPGDTKAIEQLVAMDATTVVRTQE